MVGPDIGAIRIDSGNLLADSIRARALLDELGAVTCRIVVSGDLDEFRVAELEDASAPVDAYLVGTSLVTDRVIRPRPSSTSWSPSPTTTASTRR